MINYESKMQYVCNQIQSEENCFHF